jgi:prevent-host-death family protein
MVMPKTTRVPAAEFKARCLELMDRVRETRETYIITKHGRPVARLVACEAVSERPLFGSLAGTILEYRRPFDPIPGGWFTEPAQNSGSRRRTSVRKPRKKR